MAPILPFTTEEAWEVMPHFLGKEESVHLEQFPLFEEKWLEPDLFQELENLILLRDRVLKELERARESKFIGNSLEAKVLLKIPDSQKEFLAKYEKDLPSLFIVSSVALETHPREDLEVEVTRAPGKKCQRCWNFSPYVGESSEYPFFCKRCEEVVKEMRP
jgi:isoleucyl-tRNA synthetase